MDMGELRLLTYNQAYKLFCEGGINSQTFNHYCYIWRNESFRYSDVGINEAAQHAADYSLSPPYSDRPLTSDEINMRRY